MELFSTIIQLRPRQNSGSYPFAGRQVQAWFLREVARHSTDKSVLLHDSKQDSELRPYTLSTLYKGLEIPRMLTAGDWCWMRVTALTSNWSQFFVSEVLPNLLPVAKIGPVEFEVLTWTPDNQKHPWVGEDSYAGLKRQALTSDSTRLILDFYSPTSFKQHVKNSTIEKDVPLPIPEMVFGNYAKHWNTYSGESLPVELGDFIQECVAINELYIHSERVTFSNHNTHRATTGFTGQVHFSILGNKLKSRFGALWEHYANITRMLALYSFYCGSGQDTTAGLGQTRAVL